MPRRKIILLLPLFLYLSMTGLPAQDLLLEIRGLDIPGLKKLSWKEKHSSEMELKKELQAVLFFLQERGYLTASVDSLKRDSLRYTAWLSPGGRYEWAWLRPGNAGEEILGSAGYSRKAYGGKPFRPQELSRLLEKIIAHCENNGYPFAMVKLDSVLIEGEKISASLFLDKGPLVKIDSLIITGKEIVSKAFISRYLGIREASLYDESAVKKISGRLNDLSFLKEDRSSMVIFSEKHTKLYLFPGRKKASRFDGIVGFLPDNRTGKILFTGDISLQLQNALRRGERMDINWRSLQQQTQDLKAKFMYPYLLGSPLGAGFDFNLYKKDSSYVDVISHTSLHYLFTGSNNAGFFYRNKKSDLLSTKGLEFTSVLPPYADVRISAYGLSFYREELDYRFNPRKGYRISLSASAGTKRIRRNPNINPSAYDGISEYMPQYEASAYIEGYLPLAKRSALRLAYRSAYLHAPVLLQNDLGRIGGLLTLRGFDEESIAASWYSIATAEYRFLLEQNSWFYLFADGAYYENKSLNFSGDPYDTPLGFGAGMSFETKAGIFSINYALGRQFDNPVSLRAGKIHFGINAFF